ncbi:MAG TPA: hypothetical protein VFS10_13510 [Pyrinomonadaceae bacterium]|nr:hypothetical protein [Pyrinomonadaceae bacterium]
MRRRTWGRLLCAACLALCAAFAYQALAAARLPLRATEAQSVARQAPVLRGTVLLAFGAYELNVSFTPDGQIQRFQLNSVPPKRCGGNV